MTKISIENDSLYIKQLAKSLDFDFCGIAKAEFLDEEAQKLESWLNKGFHGKMQYMENHFDLRVNPQKLVPNAKSVITLLKNYYTENEQNSNTPKISKYAFGKDYHEVIKTKLKQFLYEIEQKVGKITGRGFVDSAPVLERAWGVKSGLGWVGKNGNLITKKAGSYFFIATLIVDIELKYDSPFVKDFCGTCTKCLDACPTNAILPNKVVDGSKCISYFSIELKDALIDDSMKNKFKNWMFGCDVCMNVCPWNSFAKQHHEIEFTPIPEILNFTTKQWEELTEETFNKIFKNSPLKRSKFTGIKRNLQFIQHG